MINLNQIKNSFGKKSRILFSCTVTLILLGIATALNFLFAHFSFPEANITLIYLMCVIFVTSFTDGFFYGIVAGILSIIAFNVFFAEPYFSFSVYDSGYVVTFIVMTITAIFTSTLTTKIKASAYRISKTEKQAIEERYRANLLRAISHDIRTPLSSIIGNTQILLSYSNDEKIVNKIKEINEDATWLHSLVENILNLTRLKDGKLVIKKELNALEEVVEVAVRRTAKLYPHCKIEVSVPKAYLSVPMDAKLVEQVLMNLLENAIKHNKKGIKIEISFRKESQNAVIVVKDNGVGIGENELPRIFEVFYSKYGQEKKSKGLGLAICEAIIKAHGGEIFAKNAHDGKGAEFIFTLPLEDRND